MRVTPTLPPAIVLAGGLGTRLREITGDRCPKPMVPTPSLGGQVPFLDWPLGWLHREGVRDIVICTGHLGEQIEQHYSGPRPDGVSIRFDHQADADTGARCRAAFDRIEGDAALVFCGDVYVDMPVAPLVDEFSERDTCDALLACVPPPKGMCANLETASDGKVTRFDASGLAGPNGALEAGVLMLRRTALAGHDEGVGFSLTDHLYPRLMQRGRLCARRVEATFLDIGTPERYRRFCALSAGADPAHGLSGILAECC